MVAWKSKIPPNSVGSGPRVSAANVSHNSGGDCPERLRKASYEMAIFLRYQAIKNRDADHEGWVRLSTLTSKLSKKNIFVSEDDILQVVRTSYTRDRPRFEQRQSGNQITVRAVDGESYRNRRPEKNTKGGTRNSDHGPKGERDQTSWRNKSSGSSTVVPRNVENDRASHPTGAASSSCTFHGGKPVDSAEGNVFDGLWSRLTDEFCHIQGTRLVWLDPDTTDGSAMPLKIIENTIWVVDDKLQDVKGTLAPDGSKITFEDGDSWTRVPEEEFSDVFNHVSRTSSCSQGHCDGMISEVDYAELRVIETWDATSFGPEYLSLKKGELLSVKLTRDQGWAFGYSIQQQKDGWFPPAYIGDSE